MKKLFTIAILSLLLCAFTASAQKTLLSSHWTQNSPYNMLCPRDPGNNYSLSVAGCPAIAMGQIINYLRTTQDTRFDDGDDYYHNYEDEMVKAAKNYIKTTNYKINDAIISVELETLVNTSSIDVLYDKKSNKKCTGYVVISSDTDYKSYLQCDEYKTVG